MLNVCFVQGQMTNKQEIFIKDVLNVDTILYSSNSFALSKCILIHEFQNDNFSYRYNLKDAAMLYRYDNQNYIIISGHQRRGIEKIDSIEKQYLIDNPKVELSFYNQKYKLILNIPCFSEKDSSPTSIMNYDLDTFLGKNENFWFGLIYFENHKLAPLTICKNGNNFWLQICSAEKKICSLKAKQLMNKKNHPVTSYQKKFTSQ